MALTAIGRRTLKGFIDKYGAKVGPKRFEEAMANGTIDRGKMENLLVAEDGKDTSAPVEEGSTEELRSVENAVTKGGIAGLDDVSSRPEPRPNPTRPGKRKLPIGLARRAGGAFQARPG